MEKELQELQEQQKLQEKTEQVEIHTEFIKLDSFLKFAGIAETGGHAKLMVEEGDVLVDGEVCLQRGRKLYPGMTVEFDEYRFLVTEVAAQ